MPLFSFPFQILLLIKKIGQDLAALPWAVSDYYAPASASPVPGLRVGTIPSLGVTLPGWPEPVCLYEPLLWTVVFLGRYVSVSACTLGVEGLWVHHSAALSPLVKRQQ